MRHLEVSLSSWQRTRLRQLRDRPPAPRVGRRAACLLLSAAGESAAAIARVTGLSRDAVTDVRRRWRASGMRSLADRPRGGRPPRVDAAYRRELRSAVRRGPAASGYAFTVWSVARLAAHLARRTGVRVGRDWLRRLLRAAGFVYGRPAHTLKGRRDEPAYRKAKRALAALKRGP
jgi:transposase